MNPTGYRRRDDAAYPPLDHPAYRSTGLRHPAQPLVPLEHTLSEVTGPGPALAEVLTEDADLTTNAGTGAEAVGERIIVTGRVLDEDGSPQPNTLVEVWQANAAGRYIHERDQHPAPLDPNFIGRGRCVTDEDGSYRFTTIRPGAYPWRNHPNAWRPAHIHFSLFGPALVTRVITQMYFPGDPLHALDPIMGSVPEEHWHRMIATYDHDVTQQEWALGFRWDIVLRGPEATPFEAGGAGALA
ncbi:MAG TPA: protocatechuate 3,4-dioxygenase subunit beta [Egicoccus sp.]|nr:protocatechuate 3,4-dioxygenase subunit beta [Egicoccus sp.]HSK25126.1 protocatechuate 3,4-dioxygenase subunit beta [Egicoccus sp.]